MKILFCFLFLVFSSSIYSQPTIMQSDHDIKWHQIEDNHFKVVFPDYLEDKAQYTLNLLNYYRPIVGKLYASTPQKITLIIRPEMALPNGFVTLAPRRTEWFHNSTLSPFIGSLEWYQALAIHEYRHIVQYDHLAKGNTRFGYYAFGESILGFLMNIVAPSWYFEGDAVWGETVYSDAGRGRSPRFSSRFKALLTSNQFPTYDDILTGDYENSLVNWYVYGYFLITRGVQKYGEHFWVTLSEYAADRPWNPYSWYSSFRALTGEEFDSFYMDTLKDLKKNWGNPPEDFLNTKKQAYYTESFPIKENNNLYYLQRKFNGRTVFYKNSSPIKELRVYPDFSNIDVKDGLLIYSQDTPHYRYLFKSFSDLFLLNTKSEETIKLTSNQKYFHPRFSPEKKIVATKMGDNDEFTLDILDLNGKVLKSFKGENGEVYAQGSWVDENTLAMIVIEKSGKKKLSLLNIKSDSKSDLLKASRNNLYNPYYSQGKIYFEADYKGKVNIFSYDINSHDLGQCTDEYISARMPSVSNGNLHYVWESAQGSRKKSKPLNCTSLEKDELTDIKNYISKSPSDNYHEAKPVEIDNYEQFYEKSVNKVSHAEGTNTFKPHSWSFIGDRGFQAAMASQNELGTMSFQGATGIISGEGTPFASLDFNYMKYYPVINVYTDFAKRHLRVEDEYNMWNETKLGTNIILPYLFQKNYFTGTHFISLNQGLIKVSENNYIDDEKLNDEDLVTTGINLFSSVGKNPTYQQIQSPWSYLLNLNYINLKSDKRDRAQYLAQYQLSLNTPGFSKNHGFNFDFSGELRPNNEDLYQLQTDYVPVLNNPIARGYAYEFTPRFDKISLNYVFPLSYPKVGFRDWVYLKRVYTRAFYDYNVYENLNRDLMTANSKGAEFIFETNTLRKFPLSYGLRVLHKEQDDTLHAELFFASLLL